MERWKAEVSDDPEFDFKMTRVAFSPIPWGPLLIGLLGLAMGFGLGWSWKFEDQEDRFTRTYAAWQECQAEAKTRMIEPPTCELSGDHRTADSLAVMLVYTCRWKPLEKEDANGLQNPHP